MTRQLGRVGNASSLHASGRAARRRRRGVARDDRARARRAARPRWSSPRGGTESDNLAVKGVYWARGAADPRRRRILTTRIEHHAVLDAVDWLAEHEDAEVELAPGRPTSGGSTWRRSRRPSSATRRGGAGRR